jgi:pilus assembly protein FimV
MARDTQGSPASEKRLEQYGVWVKVKPREVLESAAREDPLELSDLESARPASRETRPRAESALTIEEEQLLDELDTELGPQDASTAVAVPDEEPLLEDAELPDIDEPASGSDLLEEELPELDEAPIAPARPAPARAARPAPRAAEEEREIEVTLSEETVEPDHFDDLEALENELATTASSAREAVASSSSSAEILSRIEDELRSIRTDLTQLRTELSGLRDRAAAAPAPQGAEHADASGGFFDEDEDETIALTGDELDNILNNADITEESAEASTAGAGDLELVDLETVETPNEADALGLVDVPAASEPADDILSYETPAIEEDALPAIEADDTLVLTDDALLPGSGEGAEPMEELPSELVLDDLAPAGSSGSASSDELVEVDLEALPEIESEPAPSSRPAVSLDDIGDETIDLETLDLGEEPKVIDAVAEQADDLSMVEDAEVVLDEDEPAAALASAEDIMTDDVDLEALAAEAEELEGNRPSPHPAADDDLEIGELESITDDAEAVPAAEEVEIPFEAEAPTPSPDVDAELEQILDAEDVAEEEAHASPPSTAGSKGAGARSPATAAGSIEGVPDSLKEEIGTVLKYLDNLLEALPEDKIKEFAGSDYFVMYKKLFEDLGLVE